MQLDKKIFVNGSQRSEFDTTIVLCIAQLVVYLLIMAFLDMLFCHTFAVRKQQLNQFTLYVRSFKRST
ncbi:MAG: hypothetical protein JWR61_4762 [Ferruginibacter sp.]|nr:hypothetical protein [Ferruginibacter sp.]